MWIVSRTTRVDESFERFFFKGFKSHEWRLKITILALLPFLAAGGVCSPLLDLGSPMLGSSFCFLLISTQVSNKYFWEV